MAERESKALSGRSIAIAGARGVVGLIGVGIAVASVAAASLLPLPTVGTGPGSVVVTPVAATQQRICAGPVLRLGSDTGQQATTANSIGRAEVTRAATVGTPSLENLDATQNEKNVPPQRLLLEPGETGEEPGILAGSQSQFVSADEFVGFAASECAAPSSDSWLVGGSTLTGRTTLLALTNPSKVSSTVNLTVYSEKGTVAASGTDGIIVPPGGQRVFSLAAFAPDIASPVVHVVSTGGQVTATLQQSILRTLTPGGVDVFGVGTRPSRLTVIPGVVTVGHQSVEAASSLGGYGDLVGTLRVLVPGTGSTDVTVSAIPEGASGAASSSTLTLEGGIVTDFPLGDFPDGTWTLTVASERPAVVGARSSTVTLAGDPEKSLASGAPPVVVSTDFAWFVGAPELDGRALVSIAPGPSPRLHLVNTGTESTSVAIDPLSGGGTTVTIDAGAAVAVPVAPATSYTLSGMTSVRASVSYLGDGRLAGFVVSPPGRASQPVTVFHQYG
ncbi:hypothetical protein BKA04_000862 [Cryobacterium mesophilum]|uniref:Large extracellular alpha-helical protein n=1 Tax=Terrimesophilobacter mesophilus TaxID=433647 RepID=A0A4R8VBG7_9MICO|nr:DUF5719 family protein [Terrimesophilobacter mesophilus]MBB5632639.1 hypothetical protein [Terrimesophilobacter mesophilus]TFB79450.1 hypothetical protein E3N84_04920 [Terrimesophilobacter mesophilus]